MKAKYLPWVGVNADMYKNPLLSNVVAETGLRKFYPYRDDPADSTSDVVGGLSREG